MHIWRMVMKPPIEFRPKARVTQRRKPKDSIDRGSPSSVDMATSSPALTAEEGESQKPRKSRGPVESAKPGNNCGPRPSISPTLNAVPIPTQAEIDALLKAYQDRDAHKRELKREQMRRYRERKAGKG